MQVHENKESHPAREGSVALEEPALGHLRAALKTLTQLCSGHEQFELRGIRFFVVAAESWAEAAPETAQCTMRLRAVGKLQIQGRQHVILTDQARAQDSNSPRSFLDMLTQREMQIATLVAEGWSDKAIARRLSISEYTVREHVRRMFHKANVSKRAALASLIARRDGPGSR